MRCSRNWLWASWVGSNAAKCLGFEIKIWQLGKVQMDLKLYTYNRSQICHQTIKWFSHVFFSQKPNSEPFRSLWEVYVQIYFFCHTNQWITTKYDESLGFCTSNPPWEKNQENLGPSKCRYQDFQMTIGRTKFEAYSLGISWNSSVGRLVGWLVGWLVTSQNELLQFKLLYLQWGRKKHLWFLVSSIHALLQEV